MTDFYSVLQRAVQSLPDGSGPQRRQVYEKARKALLKQLQSFDPPLSSSDVTAQRLALEDAIRKIENEIARENRTRRAVQGAVPAGARSGAPDPAARGETEAEREARRRAEAERSRAERAEMLKSAVSDAMLPASAQPVPSAAALPAPALAPPRSFEPEPVEPETVTPEVGADFLEVDDDNEVVASVPARRRGRRAEAAETDDGIDEAEYEAVEEDEENWEDEAEAVDPKTEKRRRKEAERQVRAERRAERSSERGRRRAAAVPQGGEGRRARRSLLSRAALAVVVLGLLAGASYAAFTQRERLLAVIDGINGGVEQPRAPVQSAGPAPAQKNEERLVADEDMRTVATTPIRVGGGADAAPSTDAEAAGSWDENPDGETDAARTVGEEVSPFAAEGDAATDAEEQIAAVDPGEAEVETEEAEAAVERPSEPIPDIVSEGTQTAVLYEEAAQDGEQGSALPGTVEWEMVRQSIGGGDEEPVVRANATIGDRGMNATLTIRENRDPGLPASHLIEIKFDVPDAFEGGGVKNVPGVIMKERESARGEALRGAAARVSSGLFWIALSEDEADRRHNLDLLASRDWLDIPILYESGRRAILTLRKGNDGLRSVNAAIKEWTSG